MKSTRLSVFKSILIAAGIAGLLFAVEPNVFASAEDQIDQAVTASKGWVAQIDGGRYEESYAFGCGALHDKVPEDRWVEILKTLRTPWGPVVSRQQIRHDYKPNGVEGLEGECMVITYDTSFAHLSPAMEMVVLRWEDGKWRGAGYTAGPKPSPDDNSASTPPASATEVHTDPHVKPQPK